LDLATFNLVNLVRGAGAADPAGAQGEGDWMLVHVTPEYTTLAIVRAGHLVFFRSLRDEAEGSLADSVHQTAMYHEDRLGGGRFARVLLAGGSSASDVAHLESAAAVRATLEQRLDQPVSPLDVRSLAGLMLRTAPSPSLLDALAPPVGLLVREAA
jgi:hypothetical protein